MTTDQSIANPVMNYYHQAETHALKANELASDAREKLAVYNDLHSTIIRWDNIMANTHPGVWAIFFVIISVVEFMFSIDLYIDLLPFAPWIIPIGIIVVTVFISHALAVRFMPSLRDKEFSDKKHNPLYKDKTDEQIWAEIRKNSNTNLIFGIIGAVGITLIILWLSNERVIREIAAGMRIRPFGVYDLMPVIFYIAEIVAGILILYLLKRISKSIRAWYIKRKFDKIVRQMAHETDLAISSFEMAETNGFNILEKTISESIHIAFYRNKNCNPSDEENYIAEPANIPMKVKFRIDRADKSKPLAANIHLFSEYNYAASGASDNTGNIEIEYSSFQNDTMKKIIVEFSDGANCEDTGVFLTGNTVPHTVLFRE
jgi:hypothetical protein